MNHKSFKKEKSGKGGWGCAMFLLSQALDGKTVSFSQETCHCPGAAAGLGLPGTHYEGFPGGAEAFTYFLSCGNKNWDQGQAVARGLEEGGAAQEMVADFLEGEGFKKDPELALDYMTHIPKLPAKEPYVIIEPLARFWQEDQSRSASSPEVVIFLADAVQLSALVNLANFARQGLDSVRIPFGSGCQSIGILPLYEGTQPLPKAVVGLTDISARLYLRKLLGRELLSFAAPWSLYQEMENSVEDSFLSRHAWKKLND